LRRGASAYEQVQGGFVRVFVAIPPSKDSYMEYPMAQKFMHMKEIFSYSRVLGLDGPY